MDRRRSVAQTNPPVIFRGGGDHGARVAYWPSYDAAPMAHDGRPDHHVYVRRDLVRAWLAQHPAPSQGPTVGQPAPWWRRLVMVLHWMQRRRSAA